MRVETLKPLITIAGGERLRTNAALSISDVELFKQAAGRQILTDFFQDCAVKAGGTITPILPATQAIVTNAQTLAISRNNAVGYGATAIVDVAANVATGVRLQANAALLANTVKQACGTVSGSGTFMTPTIVNNVITGIVLSAS